MSLVPLAIFAFVLVVVIGGYFLLGPARAEKAEVKRRLSLLELRGLGDSDIPAVLKSELLSDVPLINRILSRINVAVVIDNQLKQADMKMKVGTFFLLTGVLFVVGMVVGSYLHWPLPIIAIVAVALSVIPKLVINAKKRIRLKKFMSHFPDALEMFARSLRAGHSFTGAIQLVSQEMPDPIGMEFKKVFDEQNLGIPLREALIGMTERVASLDVKFFVTAILIQRETGGNLAEIIDKISYVIRERFRIQGQLKIFTAQARLSGIILACLPIGMAVIIGVMSPDYIKLLWLDHFGRIMVVVAVVLQLAGWLVIRKIIRIKI